ncbi:MAG: hypothetical protein IIB59_02580 [Planctomycetes bacterium]|nr:hypothetical protein [Planctomycetota bacterium]
MMDELAGLMVDLGRAGIELASGGDRVMFRPRDRVGPGLLTRIRRHRRALLANLGDPGQGEELPENGSGAVVSEAVWEAAHVFFERLGVACELGLPVGIGSPAWLIAMGEALETEHATMSGGQVGVDHG